MPTLKYDYQMGFEGTKTGVNILNTNNVRRFPDDNYPTGDQVSPGAIKPFSSNNGFTLVLDYKFDSTQTIRGNAAVLVGCYERNSGNVTGFALYNNRNSNLGETGITVGYGDMFSDSTKSVFIHNPNQRNVVVIRHPANSSQLWVYSSAGNGNITSTTLTIPIPINVNTQALSNAEICLGNLRNDITSTNSTYTSEYNNLMGAQGTIYWARYWNEDLGAGECKQLAAWPHEHMTAKIAAIDADKTNELLTRPSIYLTNLTATCHGYVLPTRFIASSIKVGNSEGWGSSMAKTICDDRTFSGLPIRLQSILSKPNIGYKNYAVIEGGDFTPTATLGSIESTSAFVYVPSISSLQSIVSDSYAGESILERTGSALNDSSDITPYTWMGDASSMVVYDYDTSVEGNWRIGTNNSEYYNIRFANKPINWSQSAPLRIFRIASGAGALQNTSLYSAIGGAGAIQANDIVILSNDAAYIYVTASEYNTYGLFTESQSDTLFNTNNQGGWVKATDYMTRSVSISSNNGNFIFINARGEIVVPDSTAT